MLEYDPKLHITAGTLRAMGLEVPQNIPDCAWTPRYSMQLMMWDLIQSEKDGVLDVQFKCVFTEPFQWFRAEVTLGPLSPTP